MVFTISLQNSEDKQGLILHNHFETCIAESILEVRITSSTTMSERIMNGNRARNFSIKLWMIYTADDINIELVQSLPPLENTFLITTRINA